MKSESLGIIEPKFFKFEENFELESGKILKGFEIIYETYGELNKDKSNAVLICHALSGNHHAAGYSHDEQDKSGWWNELIGPNKAFDTNKYFIVSLNNLGGCHGSSGPSSIEPGTSQPFGKNFPLVTVKDWVKSQDLLRLHLSLIHI